MILRVVILHGRPYDIHTFVDRTDFRVSDVQPRGVAPTSAAFRDDGDMSVSFEHSQGHVTHVLDVAVKPQVLQHIVFAQVTSACERERTPSGRRPTTQRVEVTGRSAPRRWC